MAMESALSSPLPITPLLPPSGTTGSSQNTHSLLPFPQRPFSREARCLRSFGSYHRLPPSPLALSLLTGATLRSRFPSMSSCHAVFGSGSGSSDGADGGDGGGGGGGEGGSNGRETELKPVAGDLEDITALGSDVIVLHVGGMTCGGCAASVKRILESQPQVSSATVNLEKEMAFIWAVPEAEVTQDWQQELGEKLAKHLTTCGFQSNLQDLGSSNIPA